MSFAIALVGGLVFGAGLLLSGMADPARVLAFLDVAGAWNPALLFVMGGAIAAALPAFAWARRHERALDGQPVGLPARAELRVVSPRLLVGSAVFGVGWGLAGLCPGPALVLLGQGGGTLACAAVFTATLAAGLVIGQRLAAR